MKKLLVVLLALGMIGSVFVFADDAAPAPTPKISVEVNDGLVYSTNSAGSAFKDYALDYGIGGTPNVLGALVMVNISQSADTWAYSIAPRYAGGVLSFDHAWASATPVAGLTAYTSFGGNPAPFGDVDNNGAGSYSTSSIGAFYTMSGFSIGAQLGQLAKITANVPVWIGVNYSMDKVFVVNAYGEIANDTTYSLDMLNISAALKAVPNLTATVGFDISTMAATANAFADVQVGYAIGALGVGAIAYDRSMLAGTSYFAYQANVSYTVSPQVAVSAYFAGTTASTVDYQPEVTLALSPVAGTTIKLSGWYDTAVEGNGNLCGTYTGNAVSGTGGTTSFAVDVKFAY